MTLKPAVYHPTGRWWIRLQEAIYLAYVNLHLRAAESTPEDDPYGFITQLTIDG